MPRRCIVGGCSNSEFPCHTWPTSPKQASAWQAFVGSTRGDKFSVSRSSAICCLHFEPESFVNLFSWRNGFGRLRLQPGSVPTIRNGNHNPERQSFVEAVEARTGKVPTIQQGEGGPLPGFLTAPAEPTAAQKKLAAARQVAAWRHGQASGGSELGEEMTGGGELGEETTDCFAAGTPSSAVDCGVQCDAGQQCDAGVQTAVVTVSRGQQTRPKVAGSSKGCQTDRKWASVRTASTSTSDLQERRSRATQVRFDDCDDDRGAVEGDTNQEMDPDFKPSSRKKQSGIRSSLDEVILVTKSQLLLLLSVCASCGGKAEVTEEKFPLGKRGTYFAANTVCVNPGCCAERRWENQRVVRRMPTLNLLYSAAVYVSGSAVSKAVRLFSFMKIRCVAERTVFDHVASYVQPHILMMWQQQQTNLIAAARASGRKLRLLGDGRSDSPGHSAKYGTYTLMDADTNKVLASEVVQSNEVGGSYHCELAGLKKALEKVGVEFIHSLTTDRHRQLAKYLRDYVPEVLHCFDVWHVAKGINKKLAALGKESGCELIEQWRHSINNHLYWCAVSTEENNGALVLAKWRSLMEHVCDRHEGFEDHLYPSCAHGPMSDTAFKFIEPGTKAENKLERVLLNKMIQGDISRLSTSAQTSSLESFHSVMLVFQPKTTAYSYHGMIGRCALAAMHWNANSTRRHALSGGEPRYTVVYPKAKKGEASVKKIKQEAVYEYAEELISSLLVQYEDNVSGLHVFAENLPKAPPPLSNGGEKVTKADAVAQYRARFT